VLYECGAVVYDAVQFRRNALPYFKSNDVRAERHGGMHRKRQFVVFCLLLSLLSFLIRQAITCSRLRRVLQFLRVSRDFELPQEHGIRILNSNGTQNTLKYLYEHAMSGLVP
jgi:hypothetical protein